MITREIQFYEYTPGLNGREENPQNMGEIVFRSDGTALGLVKEVFLGNHNDSIPDWVYLAIDNDPTPDPGQLMVDFLGEDLLNYILFFSQSLGVVPVGVLDSPAFESSVSKMKNKPDTFLLDPLYDRFAQWIKKHNAQESQRGTSLGRQWGVKKNWS